MLTPTAWDVVADPRSGGAHREKKQKKKKQKKKKKKGGWTHAYLQVHDDARGGRLAERIVAGEISRRAFSMSANRRQRW
jgi:hypothetical protein